MFGIDDAILGSIGTSLMSNMFAAERQSNAQDFSASQFASRYQTTVKDMEAAGLNPMLAYGQGGGSPPSGAIANAQPSDLGQVINQAKIANAQAANLEADTANKDAQGKLYEAQANAQNASAGQSYAQIEQIDAIIDKTNAEIRKIKGDTNFEVQQDVLEQTARLLSQQSYYYSQQGITAAKQRQLMEINIKKIISETELLDLDIDAAKALNNIGRTYKQLQPMIELLLPFFRRK